MSGPASTSPIKGVMPMPPHEPDTDLASLHRKVDELTRLVRTVVVAPTAVTDDGNVMTTAEAMSYLGYNDKSAFLKALKRSAIPRIKISKTRMVFDRRDLQAWRDSKTVRPPVRGLRLLRGRAAA